MMDKKKKVSLWTGVASLVIGSAVAAVIYSRYKKHKEENSYFCLLYTSDAADE